MQIQNLLYLVGALVVATLVSGLIVLRHRKPKSLEAGIESFSRELKALAPEHRPPANREPRSLSTGETSHRRGLRARPIARSSAGRPGRHSPASVGGSRTATSPRSGVDAGEPIEFDDGKQHVTGDQGLAQQDRSPHEPRPVEGAHFQAEDEEQSGGDQPGPGHGG